MNILFITRKYPPQVGGMEKYSYNLIKYWPSEKQVIFLNKSQWNLVWWLPWAFLKSLLLVLQYSRAREQEKSSSIPLLQRGKKEGFPFNLIYVCDGMLAPLGYLLKKITKIPVAATACGLDITYPKRWYQEVVIPSLKKLDKIICISNATLEECVKRNIPREKLVFIPVGIEMKLKNKNGKIKIANKNLKITNLNIDLRNRKVLLTVGRLVARKGVAWFCENVMTKIPQNIIYLVIGTGPEKENIINIIEKYKLKNQVFLLGKLSDKDLEKVYKISDIFVMPNIKVKGDMEGFGIVVLEATNYGLPVVASDLEGISDAIKSGENGILVPSQNTEEFIRQINILLKDQEKKQALILRALKYNQEIFSWRKIVKQYYHELQICCH
ncbi:MAG: glycosyltransferase family 4 protein [Patescibacteria group bacterium]